MVDELNLDIMKILLSIKHNRSLDDVENETRGTKLEKEEDENLYKNQFYLECVLIS